RGRAELVLRMQREFNLLWAGSRDFVWGDPDRYFESMPIRDEDVAAAEDPSLDVAFTSGNFRLRTTSSGPSFSIQTGRSQVADVLVRLIGEARESIHIASG